MNYSPIKNTQHLYQHNICMKLSSGFICLNSIVNEANQSMSFDEIKNWLYDAGFTETNYFLANGYHIGKEKYILAVRVSQSNNILTFQIIINGTGGGYEFLNIVAANVTEIYDYFKEVK